MMPEVKQQPSWLPILLVLSIFMLTYGLIIAFHQHIPLAIAAAPGTIGILSVISCWWYALLTQANHDKKNLYYGLGMGLFVVFILWFAYLQVPLFHMVCHHFGIDGGVGHRHEVADKQVINYDQRIKLDFTTSSMRTLPVTVEVQQRQQHWYPGGYYNIVIGMTNNSEQAQTIHPILTATPERATLAMNFLNHLPQTIELAPHQTYHTNLKVQLMHDFPKDIHAVAMLINASDHTHTDKPGQHAHWHEFRARYHKTRI